jgi:hypothetical protein
MEGLSDVRRLAREVSFRFTGKHHLIRLVLIAVRVWRGERKVWKRKRALQEKWTIVSLFEEVDRPISDPRAGMMFDRESALPRVGSTRRWFQRELAIVSIDQIRMVVLDILAVVGRPRVFLDTPLTYSRV